jgi:hypothetical protein
VNWILWSSGTETAIIIIPEEAERIIPLLHNAKLSRTNLLTYAAPVTWKMLQFNDLNYYTIPSLPKGWKAPEWLMIELGIFAGRLYFQHEEYDGLCRFLGYRGKEIVDARKAEETMPSAELYGTPALAEDEISQTGMNGTLEAQSFTTKPLTFLQEWLAIRRKDQDFTHTPMGYVCQGKPLTEGHHFFRKTENRVATDTGTVRDRDISSLGGTDARGEDCSSDDEFFDDQAYSYSGDDIFDGVAVEPPENRKGPADSFLEDCD